MECDLEALQKYLGQKEVEIGVDLGIGNATARVWGCDLTEGYVKENATIRPRLAYPLIFSPWRIAGPVERLHDLLLMLEIARIEADVHDGAV